MLLGNMNTKVGDVRIEGITGSFGVLEVNEIGESFMCAV